MVLGVASWVRVPVNDISHSAAVPTCICGWTRQTLFSTVPRSRLLGAATFALGPFTGISCSRCFFLASGATMGYDSYTHGHGDRYFDPG
mgnify:CR=1 FL=1